MDKINVNELGNYFGDTRHSLLFAGDRYTEQEFSFAEQALGSGNVWSITTPGMRLSEFRIQTGKPLVLADTMPSESVESAFILNGEIESRFTNTKGNILFRNGQHNLQYNTDFSGEHRIHTGEFHALTITYEPSHLARLMSDTDHVQLQTFRENLEKKQRFLASPRAMHWDIEMNGIIQSIRRCRFQGLTRYLFIESKMMELFALQLDQLHMQRNVKTTDKWQVADKDKLAAVREFIEQSYLEPLSLKDLTTWFGLNEFKLKKGYKEFFHSTVFGHVNHLRMQKAKQLLQEKAMNVSETAWFIGYDNVSSFSSEFKKRFGYNPGLLK